MNLKEKFIIFLVILSIVSFVYFRDRFEEPQMMVMPDNTSALGCNADNGYILRTDPQNQSNTQCYKEAGFGHIKYTFLLALSMSLWTGVGLIFFIEYKKRDESPVVQFVQDKYQTENRPIPRCPDIFSENGFTWTFKGYSAIISSTEDVLFIATNSLVKRISTSLLFWGAREKITPLELYHYIGKNPVLFKRITGADASGYTNTKLVRKEESIPEIYIARPLPYSILKAFYTEIGGYAAGADRFDSGIKILLQTKRSITFLSKKLDETLVSMVYKGEKFVASNRRTAEQADKTRDTKTTESSRVRPEPQYDPRRGQI